MKAINRHYLGVDDPNVRDADGVIVAGPEYVALQTSDPARFAQFMDAVYNVRRHHSVQIDVTVDERGVVKCAAPSA